MASQIHDKSSWLVWPPSVGIPDSDRNAVRVLGNNITHLQRYIEASEHDLELFEFSRQKQNELLTHHSVAESSKYSQWMRAAAHDICMNIYHFAKIRQEIPGNIRSIGSFKGLVDESLLKIAGRQFETLFADYAFHRKGVAHAGDFAKSLARVSENSSRNGIDNGFMKVNKGVNIYISSGLMGNNFVQTVEGKTVSLEISSQTISNLYECFESLMFVLADVFLNFPRIRMSSFPDDGLNLSDRTHLLLW